MTAKRPWTEGPLEVLEAPWKTGNEFCVAVEDSSEIVAEFCGAGWDTNQANARLFAASPAMYEALADLLDLAQAAMLGANHDGAEYDIDAELESGLAALRAANPAAFITPTVPASEPEGETK